MTKETFIESKNTYQQLLSTLIKTLNTYNNTVEKNKQIDGKMFLAKFDVLLQHSLIQIAICDKEFHSEELIFIKELTDVGDYVLYLNSKYNANLSWESFYKAKIEDVEQLIEKETETVADLSTEFVSLVSLVDAAVEEADILQIIFNLFSQLANTLIHLDGEAKENVDLINDCLLLKVIRFTADKREEATQYIKQNSKEPEEHSRHCDSLEDLFNKKHNKK